MWHLPSRHALAIRWTKRDTRSGTELDISHRPEVFCSKFVLSVEKRTQLLARSSWSLELSDNDSEDYDKSAKVLLLGTGTQRRHS